MGGMALAVHSPRPSGMRAPRFPLHLTVLFRPMANGAWQQASTENISASGLLVRWNHPLPLDTAVEFRFTLPSTDPKLPGGEVAGQGRVVRVVAAPAERPECGFAIAIDRYDLRPPSPPTATRH
jgi:PilZ domain